LISAPIQLDDPRPYFKNNRANGAVYQPAANRCSAFAEIVGRSIKPGAHHAGWDGEIIFFFASRLPFLAVAARAKF